MESPPRTNSLRVCVHVHVRACTYAVSARLWKAYTNHFMAKSTFDVIVRGAQLLTPPISIVWQCMYTNLNNNNDDIIGNAHHKMNHAVLKDEKFEILNICLYLYSLISRPPALGYKAYYLEHTQRMPTSNRWPCFSLLTIIGTLLAFVYWPRDKAWCSNLVVV